MVLGALYFALIETGPAKFFTAPNAQKLFYLHVPSGLITYLAFLMVVGGSMVFLYNGSEYADSLAKSSTELGIVFGFTKEVIANGDKKEGEWKNGHSLETFFGHGVPMSDKEWAEYTLNKAKLEFDKRFEGKLNLNTPTPDKEEKHWIQKDAAVLPRNILADSFFSVNFWVEEQKTD